MQKRPVLYIGNLHESITEDYLYSVFIPFGEIKNMEIPIDPATNAHKGYAFVEYEEQEDADHAIFNLNDSELTGIQLRREIAQSQLRTSWKV